MFTGLIETVGWIESISADLKIKFLPDSWIDPLQIGESIAVNGCCLTAVKATDDTFSADLSEETLLRTSFRGLKVPAKVNLERAMKVNDRFGGHIVQGHVDGTGALIDVEELEASRKLIFEIPSALSKYLVDKCSIAIEGISLTVVEPLDNKFAVWIIPHTWEFTNLHDKQIGDPVNMEIDLIARYVEKLVAK